MSAGSSSRAPAPGGPPPARRPVSSLPRPQGLVLSPFRALRYDPAVAGELSRLTSPPYDVLSDDGVAALEAADEHNVVRLILPRDSGDNRQDRYGRAADTLRRWRDAGVLRPDDRPALYVYEQASPDGHVQRGLLGALALTPPEDGIVLPHENTMAGPVSDRLALYTTVEADLEPIFLVYDGGGAAGDAVRRAGDDAGPAPLVDAVLEDGLRHRLWALTDRDVLREVAADLRQRKALIADGHHRYATYLRRQAAQHEAGRGSGPWDAGLCLLVDATAFGPQVSAIHRYLPGQPVDVLARRTSSGASVQRLEVGLPGALDALRRAGEHGPAFLLSDGEGETLHLVTQPDRARLADAVPPERSAAWAGLDVSVLHTYLVPVLWGLPDDTEHVGYEHDVGAALAAARRTAGTAVLLNPTPLAAVAAVAAAGERMPRKSTLFTPKPRTGVVIRDHRDA
jgi:uncharacterized protein (DUF1015 family)